MRLTELGAGSDLMISDEAVHVTALLAVRPDVEQVAGVLLADNTKLRYVITGEDGISGNPSTTSAAEEVAFRTGASLYRIGGSEQVALRALTLKPGDVIEFGSVRLQVECGADQALVIAVYDLSSSDRSPIAIWPTSAPVAGIDFSLSTRSRYSG